MNKITKAWTYGVAYLSLAVGSGVSISGNIADTYRVAGTVDRIPDGLDIAISAFWPAAVLLAIEMFVSRLWPRTRPMQSVRWAGSLGIGFVAMYVSWHHLADLLSSRGQDGLVSSVGPLAIDGLAIMATGLILSSRGHKIVDSVSAVLDMPVMTLPAGGQYFATAEDVAESEAAFRGDVDMTADTSPQDIPAGGPAWWTRLEADMSGDTVPAAPVSAPPAVRPEGIPSAASEAIASWLDAPEDDRVSSAVLKLSLSSQHGRTTRTVGRWIQSLKAERIS